jgi:dihydrofolate reductase
MKKIIMSNLVSLDGYFAGPNGELDWFVVEEEFFSYAKILLNSADELLYGRITYEHMAAYWPDATENDPGITHKMNHLSKIVFSKTLKTVEWNNSRLVKNIDPQEIAEWKLQPGKDMVIFGSGVIVSAFAKLGLIDEFRFVVNPVILGEGMPLFTGLSDTIKLTMLKSQVLSSGVVILYYAPTR